MIILLELFIFYILAITVVGLTFALLLLYDIYKDFK